MSVSTLFNLLAVTVSVVALLATLWFGALQVRTARHANHLPALMDLLSEFRNVRLHDQYQYVCTRLGQEHDPNGGLRGLPHEVRETVYNVAYFFQTLASLYAAGIIDEPTATLMVRRRAATVWAALRPFVERERRFEDVEPNLLSLLEAYAEVSADFNDLPPAGDLIRARHQSARHWWWNCLFYTSDPSDEEISGDVGGCSIIQDTKRLARHYRQLRQNTLVVSGIRRRDAVTY
ncbi:hypothetical protein HLK59_50205, partial [Streptomyces sp. S3(2020)]|uniref:DUF4760 domain-containing protein n=1 Tax=Streptomyces sp. S3(2020) TaxID=2732044 RepID=UPI0014886F09